MVLRVQGMPHFARHINWFLRPACYHVIEKITSETEHLIVCHKVYYETVELLMRNHVKFEKIKYFEISILD